MSILCRAEVYQDDPDLDRLIFASDEAGGLKTPVIRRQTDDRVRKSEGILRKVLADELGHLEHIDDRLTGKHGLERHVCFDVSLILRILKLMLLDIRPKLFYDFTARHRTLTDHHREFFADLHRFHER